VKSADTASSPHVKMDPRDEYARADSVRRVCVACDEVYVGALACPKCGEPGEPVALPKRRDARKGRPPSTDRSPGRGGRAVRVNLIEGG